MNTFFKSICAFALLAAGVPALQAQSPGERIISFHSDIYVHPDTTMTVRETIRVLALQQQIKRGIFRDFPTDYHDRLGNRYRVGFHVDSVRRDGSEERFRVESLANGRRVRIGDASHFLPPGEYEYEIVYRTSRQLGLFAGHDELYWNVTGTGWMLPIDQASATVRLPEGIATDAIRKDGFTGPQGTTGRNFESTTATDQPEVGFITTSPLYPGEGLTIVVGWPKGFINPPSWIKRLGFVLADNPATVRMGTGLIVVTAYFMLAWMLIGRDPARGTIIPRYHPPKGLSPAACRFIHRMGFDSRCFAAALLNLAVKGVVKLKQFENGVLSVIKRHPEGVAVSPGESALYRTMMPYEESMALTQTNHVPIRDATEALKESLEDEFEQHYFLTNRWWFFPGLVLAGLAFVYGLLGLASTPVAFVIAGLCATLLGIAALHIYRAVHRSISYWRALVVILGLAIGVPLILVLTNLSAYVRLGTIPIAFLLLALACGLVCLLFYELLKRPTLHGRRAMDEVEGFRMYLKTAETDRLETMYPPEKTPELFERYLPYALALGVAQEWAEGFSAVLVAAANDPGQETTFEPAWFDGYHHHHHGCITPGLLTSAVDDSLSTSIASASTPPGSTSGFLDSGDGSSGGFGGGFGGGFSGGFSGGGGGGGGGW